MTQHGSLIWTDTGVEGNGVNGYINPQVYLATSANFTITNAGIQWYPMKNHIRGEALFGAYEGNTVNYILVTPKLSTTKGYGFLNGGMETNKDFITVGSSGLMGLYRSPLNESNAMNWGLTGGALSPRFGQGSQAINLLTPVIFGRLRLDKAGAVDYYSSEKIKFAAVGASYHDIHGDLATLNY